MTFDKPKNIGLITMCKYIDDNIYTNNSDFSRSTDWDLSTQQDRKSVV